MTMEGAGAQPCRVLKGRLLLGTLVSTMLSVLVCRGVREHAFLKNEEVGSRSILLQS